MFDIQEEQFSLATPDPDDGGSSEDDDTGSVT